MEVGSDVLGSGFNAARDCEVFQNCGEGRKKEAEVKRKHGGGG